MAVLLINLNICA